MNLESKVSFESWALRVYLDIVHHFDNNKPNESFGVGLAEEHQDPYKPGWVWHKVKGVVIPRTEEYEARNSIYIKLKRSFIDRLIETAREAKLQPKVFDHCQPIDVLSQTDIDTMRKVEAYYKNTVTGSYNRYHRFFRLTETGTEIVPWSVDDGTDDRQILAYGEENQHRIRTSSVLIAGIGGIGWKIGIDCLLKGITKFGLVDPDTLEKPNLSRIPVPESQTGQYKVTQMAGIMEDLRPNVICDTWSSKIQDIPKDQLSNYNVWIVTTDNVKSRDYINRTSFELGIPTIQIGASLENGMRAVSCRTVVPGRTPQCYSCWKEFTLEQMQRDYYTPEQLVAIARSNHPYNLPGPVPSIVDVNSLAAGLAGEAMFRLLTNRQVIPKVYVDLKTMQMKTFEGRRDPNCKVCSNSDFFLTDEPG
jgi:molybdopterin/thiamine biosynthesis adenylyltransferase